MGGASSRFDQTQWWNADGELGTSDGKEGGADQKPTIIPSENPTKSLEIFDILKSKSMTSQRDFEIRDGNKNVVYATRSVPGTLAWFDVVRPRVSDDAEVTEEDEGEGNEEQGEGIAEATEGTEEDPPSSEIIEELLLRIQVDWNRRSWIVYSCIPVFPGQLPATISDRKGLSEDQKLYKSCCITLSWSKSLALVSRFGPPTKLQDFWDDGDDDDDDLVAADGLTASRRDSDFFTQVFFKKADTIAARARKEHVGFDTEELRKEQASTTTKGKEGANEGEEDEDGNSMIGSLAKSVKTLLEPKEPSRPHLSKKEKQVLSLEGVVDLEAPLLQCQAVLGTKANYQSRLANKEETLKLWMLDDAWNKERFLKQQEEMNQIQDPFRNPLAKAIAYEKGQLQTDLDIEELKKWFSSMYVDDDQLVSSEEPRAEERGNAPDRRRSLIEGGKSWFSSRLSRQSNAVEDTSSESKGNGEGESESAEEATASDVTMEDTISEAEETSNSIENKVYGSSKGVIEADNSEDRREALVSYWQWKNTYTTHKMQLHLAKNSDLALHVVLSIILNICRYEWH